VRGMAIFPNLTAEQREKGLTDFNDLTLENPRKAETLRLLPLKLMPKGG
jgi:hypothetical protein